MAVGFEQMSAFIAARDLSKVSECLLAQNKDLRQGMAREISFCAKQSRAEEMLFLLPLAAKGLTHPDLEVCEAMASVLARIAVEEWEHYASNCLSPEFRARLQKTLQIKHQHIRKGVLQALVAEALRLQDVDLARELLSHPAQKVQLAALSSMSRCAAQGVSLELLWEDLLERLSKGDKKISKQAGRTLLFWIEESPFTRAHRDAVIRFQALIESMSTSKTRTLLESCEQARKWKAIDDVPEVTLTETSSSDGSIEADEAHEGEYVECLAQSEAEPMSYEQRWEALDNVSPSHIMKHLKDPQRLNQLLESGYTPLTLAIDMDLFRVVRFLLDNGADPNLTDRAISKVNSPLSWALGRDGRIFDALIAAGADVNGRQGDQSILDFYIDWAQDAPNGFELLEKLLEAGADPTKECSFPLVLAVERKAPESVLRALLEGGVDIDAVKPNVGSALQAAVERSDRQDIIGFLLDAGADPA